MTRRSVVTALTLARLPFVALGWWAALKGAALSTVTFGLSAVATDMADGRLARRWNVETEWGANLDSFVDAFFYGSLLFWVWRFNPEPIERHVGLFSGFVAAYTVMILAGYFFKRSIAVHTRVSRATGTAGGIAGLWFIAFGYHEWMLAIVALFATADIAQRLHSVVQAIAVKRRGFEE